MFRDNLRAGIHHVGVALRDPESFAVEWSEGRSSYQWPVWISLLVTAIIGTTTYGMTMGLLGGAHDIAYKSLICTLAAGLAWAIPLPALYILNSLSGSRLAASSTLARSARDRELGRISDDRVDSDQLVLHRHDS